MPIIKGKNFIFQKLWVKDIDHALICEKNTILRHTGCIHSVQKAEK